MDIWFTSDLHLGHRNIITYSNRPFSSVEEMDETLIKNWNSVVKPNDLIFNLGDMFFHKAAKAEELAKRLNGRIILIKGNHDAFSDTKYRKMGMSPYKYYQFEELFLSHKPFNVEALRVAKDYGVLSVNLCGHTHEQVDGLDKEMHFNVCVENYNYTPVHLDDIRLCLSNNKRPYRKD